MNDADATPKDCMPFYSRGQVILAGLLGGPIGAALASRKTAIALDDHAAGKRLLMIGVGMLLALFIVAGLLPTDSPNNSALAVVFFMPVVLLFESTLKGRLQVAMDSGAKKHSWWRAAGTGALGMLASLVAIAVLALILPLQPVNTLERGANVIYYEGEATEEDAEHLAAILEREGVFNPDAVWEMTLYMPRGTTRELVIEVPFLEPVENTESHEMLRALRDLLQFHYEDKRVAVHATNVFGHVTLRVND